MPESICEICHARPAVVFITQMVDNTTKKGCFCEGCARAKASGEGWLSQLAQGWSDESEAFTDAMRAALEAVPLEEILIELFEVENAGEGELENHSLLQSAFDDDFEENAFEADMAAEKDGVSSHFNAFETETPFEDQLEEWRGASQHCPNCATTWDTLKRDGRAGCPECYAAFRAALAEVMGKVQRSDNHVGKTPRAAQKRGRRLKNLQTRRENQLQMLRNRLADAIAAEKYEEAAKLRDKIKAAGEKAMGE